MAPSESGLASGIVNTAFMMGGSLGLAVLASLSAARGHHAAFFAGAVFAAAAALIGAAFLRAGPGAVLREFSP